MKGLALALALAGILVVSACGGDDNDDGEAAAAGGCEEVDAPEPKPEGNREAPKELLDKGKTYRIEVVTNCGDFTIEIHPESAPKTTASFVALARDGFYDDTIIHRVVPSFVIQGGDPTGTGMGGPGYQTVDPPPQNARYTRGVVAMAKSGSDPPGSSGSQFFVVTALDSQLPPDYAIVGKVIRGFNTTLVNIDHIGDPQTEKPSQTVLIKEMRVEETETE